MLIVWVSFKQIHFSMRGSCFDAIYRSISNVSRAFLRTTGGFGETVGHLVFSCWNTDWICWVKSLEATLFHALEWFTNDKVCPCSWKQWKNLGYNGKCQCKERYTYFFGCQNLGTHTSILDGNPSGYLIDYVFTTHFMRKVFCNLSNASSNHWT